MLRLAAVVASLVLALGGSGGLYAAAEGSLPEQPLYAMKMVTERVRERLTHDPEAAWALAWRHADERAEELAALAAAGAPPSDAQQVRYEQQIEWALRLGEGLPPEDADLIRQRERERLEAHYRLLGDTPVLERARQAIRQRLQLNDQLPVGEQQLERTQEQERQDPGSGSPWTTVTPTPGSSYGPGSGYGSPQATLSATPNGPGDGNPWMTGTPTPGSGYGPGPGPEPTCTCTPQAQPGGPQGPTEPAPGGATPTNDATPMAPGDGAPGGDAPTLGGGGGPGGSGGSGSGRAGGS